MMCSRLGCLAPNLLQKLLLTLSLPGLTHLDESSFKCGNKKKGDEQNRKHFKGSFFLFKLSLNLKR